MAWGCLSFLGFLSSIFMQKKDRRPFFLFFFLFFFFLFSFFFFLFSFFFLSLLWLVVLFCLLQDELGDRNGHRGRLKVSEDNLAVLEVVRQELHALLLGTRQHFDRCQRSEK